MKLPVANAPWFANGLQFECTACGNCCTGGPGFIWMNDAEIARLGEHLKMPEREVLRQYCRKVDGRTSLKEKPRNVRGEYDCIFLKDIPSESDIGACVQHARRICEIYAVRPMQCRTWPFWEGNLASPEAWAIAARRCPGMNSGKMWPRQEIQERRDAR